ncbi:MAG: response regulator transcription factor [Tannerellaceae bacterium]|jgi:DNA-binding response OmpR family regulator|nr:response regulator transcription factor [Tannerellaceae bacterium]
MKALKILFADDDLKYSLLIKRFLEREGYELTYTGNGLNAVELFHQIKPDLLLLDVNMPGLNGFEVAEIIRRTDRHTLIFFLSDRSDKSDRLTGFSLQGNDYLAKPFYPEELLARIRERFQTGLTSGSESFAFASTHFDYDANELRIGNSKTLITSRQADILRMMAMRLNETVAREAILAAVWGNVSHANSLALNVQISHLRKALRNDPGAEIISVSGKGYTLKASPAPPRASS